MRFRLHVWPLLWAAALHAQAPAPAPNPADCAVSGTVVNAITGEPISGAMVTLGETHGSGAGSATDPAGKWTISDVKCGPAAPTATHAGFFKGIAPDVANLQLVSGSPLRDLKIVLMPEGSIAGRVTDANGDPLAGVDVAVLRAEVRNGRRMMGGTAPRIRTDGRGEFWVGGLDAGRYIVCADSTNLTYPVGGGGAYVYIKDCFPGSGPSAAMEIRGSDVRASLTLRTVRGLHVRGKISGTARLPQTKVQMATWPGDPLRDQSPDGPPHLMDWVHNATADADGNFDIAGVRPGSYRAEALLPAPAGGEMLFAETRVEVGATDVDNVVLALRPLASVSGTVRFEAAAGIPNPAIEVGLERDDPQGGFGFTADAEWDAHHSSFVIRWVPPGQYPLQVLVPPDGGIWLKSATLRGRDVLTQPVIVDGPTGPVAIVLTDETSDVNVTVTNSDGNPVPGQVILTGSTGRPIIVPSGPDGHAMKHGLPAGDYKVWAFDDISNVPWAEDGWMAQNAGPGQKLTVVMGSTTNATVTRTAVPQ